MKRGRDLGICVICGSRKAVTRDHIPPKGIFCQPRPNNLITVPACKECNNGASDLDERFRVHLSLHVARKGNDTARNFYEEALRTLEHNSELRREILSKLEPVYLTTESGIIHDKGYRMLWDSQAHDAIVERMIRGLYYHHFRQILANRVDIEVQWLKKLTPEIVSMPKDWRVNTFGTGEVTYIFARKAGSPLDSVWIFQFYKGHWAGGYTTVKDPEFMNSLQETDDDVLL